MILSAFRAEVAAWLEANCPAEMRTPATEEERCWGGRKWVFSSPAQRIWLERMVGRGWTAPDWPRAYGGAGLSPAETQILRQEMDRLGCRPPLERVSQALGLLGPTLLKLGTEEQRRTHLPPIARGEIRWCQGYSEPNAGSDLASLQTRAVEDGDDFVVSGQKIWTSHADKADWIFMLVRTDPAAPKHQGISFLLADMSSPGITTRPITLMSGRSVFCETFFDDVRVPRAHLVGALNDGWNVSRQLLSFERSSLATGKTLTAGAELGQRAFGAARQRGAAGLDAGLRADIARYEVDAWSFALATQVARSNPDAAHPGTPSVLKCAYTELNQRRLELLMSIGGADALEWESDASAHGALARDWLRSKANSIEGGTTEIQLNLIAKRVLGLPDAPRKDLAAPRRAEKAA